MLPSFSMTISSLRRYPGQAFGRAASTPIFLVGSCACAEHRASKNVSGTESRFAPAQPWGSVQPAVRPRAGLAYAHLVMGRSRVGIFRPGCNLQQGLL